MRPNPSLLIAIPLALAHTGEAVEEHSWLKILADKGGATLGTYGLLVAAALFTGAVLFFAYVLWRLRA